MVMDILKAAVGTSMAIACTVPGAIAEEGGNLHFGDLLPMITNELDPIKLKSQGLV